MEILIKIHSTSAKQINEILCFIYFKLLKAKLLNNLIINKMNFISLPKKKKHYTVIRSPHVFKKSKEQFGTEILQKSFNLKLNLNKMNTFYINKFFTELHNSIPAGAYIKITTKTNGFIN